MPVIIHGGAMSSGRRIRTDPSESNGRAAAPPVSSVTRDVIELLTQVEGKPVGERDVEIEFELTGKLARLVVWLSRRAAGEPGQVEQVRTHLGC